MITQLIVQHFEIWVQWGKGGDWRIVGAPYGVWENPQAAYNYACTLTDWSGLLIESVNSSAVGCLYFQFFKIDYPTSNRPHNEHTISFHS